MTSPSLRLATVLSIIVHIMLFTISTLTLKDSSLREQIYSVTLVSSDVSTESATPQDEPAPSRSLAAAAPSPTLPARSKIKPSKAEAPINREYLTSRLNELLTKKNSNTTQNSVNAVRDSKKKRDSVSRLSEEKSAQGERNALSAIEMSAYTVRIRAFIYSKWVYPDIDIKNLETVISVRILADGTIVPIGVTVSSGNAIFDRSAFGALKKSSPVEPPPGAMQNEIFNIRFSPVSKK